MVLIATLDPPAPAVHPLDALQLLARAREGTLKLIAHLDDQDLQRVHSPIMSPLVWDLAHIAAYEDLWLVHRHGGMELLHPDLAALYDAFETPRSRRAEVQMLSPAESLTYLDEVRGRTREALLARGTGDGVVCEMVLRHELQHTETMRQTMGIAGLLPAGEPELRPLECEQGWITIPAGTFEMGAASSEGFSYDNERPAHTAHTDAFEIARSPVTNASWMSFSENGGYQRREWWSQEGWAWKEQYDITHHPALTAAVSTAGGLDCPVCHVSWFEADAFARAHQARLPTEAEWEKAATWTQGPTERLAGLGQVWEWTSSSFEGYPGFVAHPYPEYSEVFFGPRFRVLRGWSWATHPRVASRTFRNWDYPQRRQIFAGLRLARDVVR